MSMNHKESIRCPKCSQLHELTVWSSITVSDSPDLKLDLLGGKINLLRCDICGQTALLPNPLLYHDEEQHLMISFIPCADAEKKQELFDEIKENFRKNEELQKLENYHFRFTTDYNSLLEKILIFDQGMNDKAIELIKLMILMQEPKKMEKRTVVFGKKENNELEFFVRDASDGMCYTSRVPMLTYETVWTELLKSGVKNKSFIWELVDSDYAASLLNGMNQY